MPRFNIPHFNLQDQKLILATVILVLILVFASLTLKPQLDNPQFVAREAPLLKNAKLAISPGESYTYEYTMGNASANLTYVILGGNGCTVIALAEAQGASVCVDKGGNDATMQNASYGVPTIILTRPWMLAVHGGWRWNVSNYMMFGTWGKHLVDTNYTVVREEDYRGRDAYVVRVESSEGTLAMDWVDAEKRILLREAGQGYEIVLTEGLPLN